MSAGDKQRAATLLLLASQVIAAAGAVLITILAARTMAPEPRGELALAVQIGYLVTVVALMGLERPWAATQQGGFAQQYAAFLRLVIPALSLLLLVTLVATAVVMVRAPELAVLLCAVGVFAALNAASRAVRVAYISSRAWKPLVVNSLASQVVLVAIAVWLACSEVATPAGWMLAYAASGLVPAGLWLYALVAGGAGFRVDRADTRTLRAAGWRLLPASFGNTALLRSDRFLLPLLGSPAQLGIYVTVATVMEIAAWPVTQWSDASLRKWTSQVEHGQLRVWRILLAATAVTALTSIALGATSYVIVTLILPADYRAATSLIVPLAIASTIYGLTRVQQGMLVAHKAASRVSIAEISGLLSSVIAYIALIPLTGMMGAVVGSIIGYTVSAVVGGIFLHGFTRRDGSP